MSPNFWRRARLGLAAAALSATETMRTEFSACGGDAAGRLDGVVEGRGDVASSSHITSLWRNISTISQHGVFIGVR